jgi:D-3-phosphoglycerate dehydrogenase
MKMNPYKVDNIILDFDSTIVGIETLEVMIELSLAGREDRSTIMTHIKEITDKAMNGTIPLEESFDLRFAELPIERSIIDEVIDLSKKTISASLLKNILLLRKKNLRIVSSGFHEIIEPIAEVLEIQKDRIYANHLVFNEYGFCTGIDSRNPLAKSQGKVQVVSEMKLMGKTLVIGDGITDFEIKKEGAADYFFCYAEFVKRDKVYPLADTICTNFYDVVRAIE